MHLFHVVGKLKDSQKTVPDTLLKNEINLNVWDGNEENKSLLLSPNSFNCKEFLKKSFEAEKRLQFNRNSAYIHFQYRPLNRKHHKAIVRHIKKGPYLQVDINQN